MTDPLATLSGADRAAIERVADHLVQIDTPGGFRGPDWRDAQCLSCGAWYISGYERYVRDQVAIHVTLVHVDRWQAGEGERG